MQYNFGDIQAFCAQWWPNRRLWITPYAYPTSFSALAQNATATNQINIQANADFVLLSIAFRASIGTAETEGSLIAPFVRLLITDAGSNEQFTNSAVDLEASYSNGQRVHTLPFPRIVQGRSVLQLQATSWAPVAETYALDVALHGVHVRAYTGPDQSVGY